MKVTRGILLTVAGFAIASPFDQPAVPVDVRSNRVSYDGYKVYRLSLSSAEEDAAAFDKKLSSSVIELQRRRESSGSWAIDIAVAPDDISAFEASAEASGQHSVVLSHDLGADFAAETTVPFYSSSSSQVSSAKQVVKEKEGQKGALPGLEWFDAYHPYADHVQYWADLQVAFPNNSELIKAGTSFEGRAIQGIHLWGKSGKDSKPAIFFNGNVHAREWITSIVSEILSLLLLSLFSLSIYVGMENHCSYALRSVERVEIYVSRCVRAN